MSKYLFLLKRNFLLSVMVCLCLRGLHAQIIFPSDPNREYYELLALKNPNMVRPIIIHPSIVTQYQLDTALQWDVWDGKFDVVKTKKESKSFEVVDPFINFSHNTTTPYGINDGAIWAGKGSNIAVSTGFVGNVGILHYAFVPLLSFSQNQPFDIPTNVQNDQLSEFAYPFSSKIDWVQRYGNGHYTDFDWGQSEIRVVYKNMTIGLSTENFKWGPSVWNPILMSYNAAGFPHLDFGTKAPINTKYGRFEGKIYWGMMSESDYFDDNVENDRKYISGFSLGFEPKIVPGLSIGLNRVLYTRWYSGDLTNKDFLAVFLKNKSKGHAKNDEYDQMLSAILHYRFPCVGFELYFEYAKNDFPGGFNSWIDQPDRTRALVFGFSKLYELKNEKILKVSYEHVSLSENQIGRLKDAGTPTYYIHSVVDNGYTHNGQIVGASMGPGSNGNILKLDMYDEKGKLGFYYSRVRFNDDYFLNAYDGLSEPYPNDFEISVGLNYVRYYGNFVINPEFICVFRKNWYYRDEVEVFSYRLGLRAQYRF